MSETKPSSLDLSTLSNDYDIVGEVSGTRHARTYMATRKNAGTKRRDDQTGVLISIVSTPEGDEGNALSHLAADTKLLAGATHRRLIPVVEGRWLGSDAFAVITQRTTDTTVAQKIATGEKFTTTRVAAILREVNGLLEWAREHNVIHRIITADRIFLEPKTDRVRVMFGVAPILRVQQSDGPSEDARAVVRLALAMLTGTEDSRSYDDESLAASRPDLPERLREATVEMLDPNGSHTAADVSAYLALIGMADPLYAGETEASRIRAQVLEEQRVEREKLAAERAEFERLMTEERATFDRFMADEREKHERQKAVELAAYEKLKADERAALERVKTLERDRAAKEKADLQAAVTAERAALTARREELERVVAEQRTELERVAAEDRRGIEALRAELKAAGELEIEKKRDAALDEVTDAESTLDREEFASPMFVTPAFVPLEELAFDDDTALMRDDEIENFEEEVITPEPVHVEPPLLAANLGGMAETPVAAPRRKWLIPAGIAALVVIAGATAIALNARNTPVQPVAKPVVKPVVAQAPVVAPPASIVPLPAPATVDSSAGSVARSLDSAAVAAAAVPKPRPKPRKIVRDTTVRADTVVGGDTLPLFRDASPKKRDTLARPDPKP